MLGAIVKMSIARSRSNPTSQLEKGCSLFKLWYISGPPYLTVLGRRVPTHDKISGVKRGEVVLNLTDPPRLRTLHN